ncbi:MAG: SDR family NAD(P)-dependent oxidoreductase [Deltaproteobacteria bacterium]|nr:SDR family NAD(P)-dependent oxidoreductase [Deltaproteobacteria bacterium]
MTSPWTTAQIPDQSGRVVVITGANSGIGFEAARVLVAKGAHVVLACRNPARASEAEALLRAETPKASVESMTLDTSRLASVRAFAESFRATHPKLDVLCNNAGVMALPPSLTEDGFDIQMATNHFGHFALTGLLIDLLKSSAPSRVVNVSSAAHRLGGDRYDAMMAGKKFNPWTVYGQSKLANILFTMELNRRVQSRNIDLRAVACHPGYAATNLQATSASSGATAGYSEAIARLANRLLAQPAAAGAWPTLYAIAEPDAQGGDFIGPSGLAGASGPPIKVRPSKAACDPDLASRLWALSVKATGVDYSAL